MIDEFNEAPAVKQAIVIPYRPRKHFRPLHESKKRFRFVVAHRRAGKSVAQINELVKKALQNERVYPPPRYAYIGPSFAQTKDLIWQYVHYYTGILPDVQYSEGDLQVKLPNGAMINLYGGGQAYNRMRGLYFDGAVADEFALLDPDMYEEVVRPCLADYRGWFIASGTSNGDDHFHELKQKAEKSPEWDVFIIPVTETDALHPDEVDELRRDMDPNKFAREMMCSFAAPAEGAYYADLMNEAEAKKRITSVPYDPAAKTVVVLDLGIDDDTFAWFIQPVGKALHCIKTKKWNGKGLPEIISDIKSQGFVINTIIGPHDLKARELGTGRSRYEIALEHHDDVFICEMHKVEDGIEGVRSILPMMFFDKENTKEGRLALRNYHRGKNGKPVHNWASHGADSIRYFAMAMNQVIGWLGSKNVTHISRGGRLRRGVRGLT